MPDDYTGTGTATETGRGTGSGTGGGYYTKTRTGTGTRSGTRTRSGSGSSSSSSGTNSGSGDLSDLGLTEAQRDSFRAEFKKLDKDGDGEISVKELKPLAVMLQSQNEGPADVEAMLEAADANDDGSINLYEFCSILQKAQRNKYRVLWEVFRMLDTDGEGYIGDKELGKLMKGLGRKEFDKSGKKHEIGMIDKAQLISKNINPTFIEMAIAGDDKGARQELLKKLSKRERGKLTFEQWCRVLGYMGDLEELSSLSYASYSGKPSSASSRELLGRRRGERAASQTLDIEEFYVRRNYKVDYNAAQSVAQLCKTISTQSGEAPEQHRLYYNGFQMFDDSKTLSSYKVAPGDKIVVVFNPRDYRLSKSKGTSSRKPNPAVIYDHFIHEGLLETDFAQWIIKEATKKLASMPTVPELQAPVTVVGDIHGQFYDLSNIIANGGQLGRETFLFMGDYVDRGYFSSETVLYLLSAFLCWPDKVTLLRGNHESENQTQKPASGTRDEFDHKYDRETYNLLLELFDTLPPCALVHTKDKKFFCAHGGISKELKRLDDIREIDRSSKKEHDGKGKMKQILWNDPDDDCMDKGFKRGKKDMKFKITNKRGKGSIGGSAWKSGWSENKERGPGLLRFNYDALNYWLKENDVLAVIRGHQQKPGYEIGKTGVVNSFPCIFTVFSAPNYTDASLQDGGLALITNDALTIKTYSWNHHPVYYTGQSTESKRFQKHTLMEHYVQFLYSRNKTILQNVSLLHLRSKIEARQFLVQINKLLDAKYVMGDLATTSSDWDFVSENLTESLRLHADIRVRHLYWTRIKKSPDAVWFEGFDYLADCLLREAQNEQDEISMIS